MLILHVLQGADRGKKFSLPEGEPQLIGRSSEALPITDRSVSRRHAELTPDGGDWFIRDLESGNGTQVNGQVVEERVKLKPGDQIRCGGTLFLFVVSHEEEHQAGALRLIDPEQLEVTVESTVRAGEGTATILGSPDPVEAALDHLRIIYDLHALTGATIDRGELLGRVMDLIFAQFRPDRGFILLGEGAEGPLEPVVVRYRETPKQLKEGHVPVSRTIIQHTLGKGEGVLSTNAMSDERFRSGDSVRDYGIRSAICVPIVASNRTFGVIYIDSQMANVTFSESQLRLLNAIGQHTGLALLGGEMVRSRVETERLAAMGQAVASVSHSIKNILQGLRGGADAVELALNRGNLELAREGWPILGRNLDRIFRLMLNMLAYSRPRHLDIELVDLNGLVREAAELMQWSCERKGCALIQELDEGMPPVPLDGNAVHQVLMNLLTNAVEHVEQKRGVVTVRTGYDEGTHEGRVEVSDNGEGVPEEWREEIFKAFTSMKGQRGTGLGLSVSRTLVKEHGGRIELFSTMGEGSTFVVVLPSDRGMMESGDTQPPRPRPRKGVEDEFE